jgi:hypothetical protein
MMNKEETEGARHLSREKAMYRYTSALERGDFETVSAVLAQAEGDPELESALLELHAVLEGEYEAQPATAPRAASVVKSRWPQSWARFWASIWPGRAKNKRVGARDGSSRRTSLVRTGLAVGSVVLGLVLVSSFVLTLTLSNPAPAYVPVEITRIVETTVEQWGGRNSDDAGIEDVYNTVAEDGQRAAQPAPGEPGESTPPRQRLIVRNGKISMAVKDTRAALRSIEEMVAEMAGAGAYIVASEERGGTGDEPPTIAVQIRIPVAQFGETMDRLAALATRVNSRAEWGQDVTEEYVDLESRLQSLETARQRLLEIMAEAEDTEALLQVEQQLTQREAEIEAIKGRMQYLAGAATLSSIEIELLPHRLSQPLDVGWQPAEVARDAWESLLKTLRGLVDIAIYSVIAILPWLALIGIVLYVAVRIIRRQRS